MDSQEERGEDHADLEWKGQRESKEEEREDSMVRGLPLWRVERVILEMVVRTGRRG